MYLFIYRGYLEIQGENFQYFVIQPTPHFSAHIISSALNLIQLGTAWSLIPVTDYSQQTLLSLPSTKMPRSLSAVSLVACFNNLHKYILLCVNEVQYTRKFVLYIKQTTQAHAMVIFEALEAIQN